MSKAWFKLNKQRIGWMPISWQGWVLTIAYVAFTIYNFFRIESTSHSTSNMIMNFILQTLIVTGFFSTICYLTAEKSSVKNMLE